MKIKEQLAWGLAGGFAFLFFLNPLLTLSTDAILLSIGFVLALILQTLAQEK